MGIESHEIDGVQYPLMRFVMPDHMDRFDFRKLIADTIKNPDTEVLANTYRPKNGAITRRSVSPIRFETTGTILATCCGRSEPRQFLFEQIIAAAIRPASDVLMPDGVTWAITAGITG